MKNKKAAFIFLLGLLLMLTSCDTNVTIVTPAQFQIGTQEKDVLRKDGLSFTISIGFNRVVKNGRYARTLVKISSEKDFSGTLQAEFVTEGTGSVVYSKELKILASKDLKVEMAIPMKLGKDEVRFSIKDSQDKEVLHKKEKVNLTYNESVYYIGVLTNSKEDFKTFNMENMKLVFLSKDDFPEEVLCLDMLDTIVLYDFEKSYLNKTQQQVLDGYDKKAGILRMNELPVDGDIFSQQILDNISTDKKAQVEREKYGFSTTYSAYNCAEIKSDENIPKVGGYAIAIVLYLIFAGPPLYFILKKMQKQGAIWLIVPLLSIGFALFIFAISTKTRLKEPYAGYFTIDNVKDNSIEQETYFTLTSPFNKTYEVEVPKTYEVEVLDMDYLYNGNVNIMGSASEEIILTKKEDATSISILDSASFDNKYFYATATKDQGVKLESNLSMGKDFKVTGSITNTISYDLTDVLLCVGDTYTMLGDVKQGETILLDNEESFYIVSNRDLYGTKIIQKLSGDNPNAIKREERAARISGAYLNFLESRMYSTTKEDVVLVGFLEQQDESGNELFEQMSVQANGIEMVTIGAQANYTNAEETFIPNLDGYIKMDNSNYFDSYRNMMGESMKFQICFDLEDSIKSLIYSKELNAEFYEKNWAGFYGNIKAYNQQKKQYDVIFESGKEDELTDVLPYLDTNNSISILVESDVKEAKDRTITFPVFSAVKEAD